MSERILVIRHGAFGDVVQIDGALRDLRAHHSSSEIFLLTAPQFCLLMQACPHIDGVIPDCRPPYWHINHYFSLYRTLRNYRFARVYDLQNSGRSSLYRHILLAGVRTCFDRDWRRHRRSSNRPSSLQRHRSQLNACNVPTLHSTSPDVGWMAVNPQSLLHEAGVTTPYVFLIPGCSARHQHKRWSNYEELASILMANGYSVVMAPGPDELDLCGSIPGINLFNRGKILDWLELAGVLSQAAFVVGNDTGPSHVASCLGRPGLALFGSHASPESTGIRRWPFDVIAVDDLQALPAQSVADVVLARLRGHIVRSADSSPGSAVRLNLDNST